MISYFQYYEAWAKAARLAGHEEWPEPGTSDVWTGHGGEQYGLWDHAEKCGVLCSTPSEFKDWVEEGDLPPSYTQEQMVNNGDIRHFSQEAL